MLQSMTAYGKQTLAVDNHLYNLEIKSVNSKQLDLFVRLPLNFRAFEPLLRNRVAAKMIRGKIELSIQLDKSSLTQSQTLDEQQLRQIIIQLKTVARETDIEPADILSVALKLSERNTNVTEDLPIEHQSLIEDALDKAMNAAIQYRIDEGLALYADLELRIQNILKGLESVEIQDPQRIANLNERMRNGLEDLKLQQGYDPSRFEQELFFYIEKFDLTEEKVRLKKHCSYFLETMLTPASGKKLGFIAQEIGREINTIGSKANDVLIQKTVVMMKDELEKIKEQLFNVL